MLIGLDLDSVLADLMTPLNDFYNKRHGTDFRVDDYFEFNLSLVWGCSIEDVYSIIFDFYESELMDQIPLMPGANEAVSYLKKDHELVVITARPDMTKATTVGWLNNHFPDTFSRIVLTNQVSREDIVAKTKGEIGSELGIEAMIDDNIDNVMDCIQHGIKGYLFSSPWNQDKTISDKIIRIHNWQEIDRHF